MKTTYAIGALGLALAMSPLAEAGFKWGPQPVSINTTYRFWDGHMGPARNSANGNERPNCQVTGSVGSSFAACWATDATNRSASCYSYDANVIDAVRAVKSDSRVTIYYDAGGQCTSVYTHVDSAADPKLP
jgi:hypothetical protein